MKERHSILIVEDEEIIRTTLREFLSSEGYEVAEAGTVAEALAVARERDFEVAVCDVQLPDGRSRTSTSSNAPPADALN